MLGIVKVKTVFSQTVLSKITTIMTGFEEAKKSIKAVSKKSKNIKTMADHFKKDLNKFKKKAKRHQIKTSLLVNNEDNMAL